MIKIENISTKTLRITVPDKLNVGDFREIEPQIDAMIRQNGKIRLLIDGSGFNGWANIPAFEAHAGFVKNHQRKVERIAVVTGHDWQTWLIGAFKMFLDPEIKAYDKSHENDALKWIIE
jgi:hypothetical protein